MTNEPRDPDSRSSEPASADSTRSGSTRSAEGAGAAESAPADGGRRRPRWWIAAATFVGGVVAGILIVGLLSAGTPEFGAAPGSGSGGPTASGAPSASGTVPVGAQAVVNAACLRVINEAQDVSTILSGVDDAVTDVDLQQLDDIVRALQPIQPRLAEDLRECQVNVTAVSSAPPGSPPAGSPPPTGPAPTELPPDPQATEPQPTGTATG